MSALRSSLGPSGVLQYEPLNRTLVATDTVRELEDLERLLAVLDTPPKQVLIRARIVEIALGDLQDLGIDWDLTYNMLMSSANRPTTFPFGRGADLFKEFRPDKDPTDSAFPPAGFDEGRNIFPFATADDFSFGTLTGGNLGVTVNLSELLSDSNLLSSPRVLALDGRVAHMQVGERIPIPTLTTDSETGNTVVTGFQEERVGIVLDVIPFVLENGLIQLSIHPEVSTVTGFAGDPTNQRPIVSTREVTTQVIVRDGATLVIGGLISATEIERMSQVPWMSRIPLLGRLFKSRHDQDDRTEVVIFITVETRTPNAEPDSRERELLDHRFRGKIRGGGQNTR